MKTKLIFAGGILSILLGLFHCTFWHSFDWATELPKLSTINSNIMQMLDLAVICLLTGLGVILVAYRKEIARSKTGRALLLLLALFYAIRIFGEWYYPEGSVALGAILAIYLLIYLVPALMRDPKTSS
jgi:magnesium-transporting ATPase (P-type)